MTRFITCIALLASLCVAASAGVTPGSISGYVRSTAGTPQMGATVQLVSGAGQLLVIHTDPKGYFIATGLTPGSYDVHVSMPSFLPTLREDVVLAAGASKVLNITLNTLFEAVGMLPPLKKSDDENDVAHVLHARRDPGRVDPLGSLRQKLLEQIQLRRIDEREFRWAEMDSGK